MKISSVTKSVTKWNPSNLKEDIEFTYIDLGSINQEKKRIESTTGALSSQAPSRARQLVKEGDILVSTVRPNLNGVAIVPPELDGATASTGFCVLRPNEKVTSTYLFNWVQTDSFVNDMCAKATGQSYPAVSDRIVKESPIPIPNLDTQLRISDTLINVDTARSQRRRSIELLDELAQSLFLDMFGKQEPSWPSLTVQDIANPTKNSIRTGPFGSQLLHDEFVDEGVHVLGIDNAVNNEFKWGKPRFITDQKYRQLSRYTVNPGDLLITIMGTCGRCAVVPEDIPTAINTKHLCCITLDKDKCLPEFLHSYFLMHPVAQSYLRKTAKGAIMSGLNMGIIKKLPIALPPLELQQQYVNKVTAVREQKKQHQTHLAHLDELFASVQQRAFDGTLWDDPVVTS